MKPKQEKKVLKNRIVSVAAPKKRITWDQVVRDLTPFKKTIKKIKV